MPDQPGTWSLQRRVELISAAALCLGLTAGSVTMFQAAAVEDDQVIDERVELLAKRILGSVEDGLLEVATDPTVQHQVRNDAVMGLHAYQIWTDGGQRLLKSHNVPWSGPILPVDYSGYHELSRAGLQYCAYSAVSADKQIVVQVAERTPDRMVEIERLTNHYLLYLLLPFAAVFGISRWLLRRAFQPLEDMATDLLRRGPHDTSALQMTAPPREIEPLLSSLNAHFDRMGHSMSVEQRFTSVAAHELRTPLAGIRAQAQLASKTEDPIGVKDALGAVMRGVDAASRVIDQLIDLHRIDSAERELDWSAAPVDLRLVYQQVVDELGSKATERHTTLSSSFEVTHVPGIEFAIFILLRNLIANAILYTPPGGHVTVHTERCGDEMHLSVDDTGTGIRPEDRQRAFERFNRLGERGRDGAGLGLSIVAQVARLHRAHVALLEAPGGGLRVLLRFPMAPPAPLAH